MVKQKSQIQWKNIDFNDPNLAIDGLAAFEECTEYNLEDILKGSSQSPKRKIKSAPLEPTKKKRKVQKEKAVSEEPIPLTPSKAGDCSFEKFSETTLPTNEFLAWTNYGLPEEILRAIYEQGFTEPTQIQQLTFPAAIMGRRDIIGAAETGSGKTLAFGLPILTGILHLKGDLTKPQTAEEKPLYALILTPTRELAMQIKNHLIAAAKFTDINVAVVVGGMAQVKQERVLSKGPEIVVATPGRLWELIQQGNPHLSKVEDIKYLVIDETDRMLERGHFEELNDLLEKLNHDAAKKKLRQNFVFSATLTLVHELPKYLTSKMQRSKMQKMSPEQKLQKIIANLGITNPKIVDITQGTGTSKTLTESRITCSIEEKDYYVYYFLQKHPGRTLIFCNSIGCVRRLANLLGVLGCRPLPLHASMQQRQRLKNLERFRDDALGVLVATDVAARGLDIPMVEHVLHYQTPRTSESYVHRSGRTARASQQGITVLLTEPSEIQNYIKLCKTLGKDEDIPIFPIQENYLNAVKERMNLARELDKLELNIRKGNSEEGWFQKAAEDMDIIIDDFSRRYDRSEVSSQKKVADIKRKYLASLLSQPIFPKGYSGKYPLSMGSFESGFIENESNKAIDVMKKSIEESAKDKRKKNIPLFKPKKKYLSDKKTGNVNLKFKTNKKPQRGKKARK